MEIPLLSCRHPDLTPSIPSLAALVRQLTSKLARLSVYHAKFKILVSYPTFKIWIWVKVQIYDRYVIREEIFLIISYSSAKTNPIINLSGMLWTRTVVDFKFCILLTFNWISNGIATPGTKKGRSVAFIHFILPLDRKFIHEVDPPTSKLSPSTFRVNWTN